MIFQEALALSTVFARGPSDPVQRRNRAWTRASGKLSRTLRANCAFSPVCPSFSRGLATSAVAWRLRNRLASSRRLPCYPGRRRLGGVLGGRCSPLLGDQAAAQLHCARGLALVVELGSPNANFFHFDPRLRALVVLFRALWLRGFSDQALRLVQRAIDEAASRGHPVSVCISLLHASTLLLWAGDLPRVSDLIEQLIVHAGRYSLAPYRALGIALKGELAIACDEPEAGLDLLHSALETLRAQQYNLFILGSIGVLAEGSRKTGQFEEALLR